MAPRNCGAGHLPPETMRALVGPLVAAAKRKGSRRTVSTKKRRGSTPKGRAR